LHRPPCVRAATPQHRTLVAGYAARPQWLYGNDSCLFSSPSLAIAHNYEKINSATNRLRFALLGGQRMNNASLEKAPNQNNSPQQEKYTCGIHLDRPEDCRHYPTSISEMVKDECEMIEAIDLKNPKRAQIKLDTLMSNSRPANR